ncbi:hypothetical protein [Anaeromyxobacter diazotrophicus]|uniref:Uncharacterized protein n=1 Tax=Anaeromyxobacter diazotrophicus TaxID=2590199 RepID=A0A7I9VI94_9BACT|nr:hypothetical protein [Anaeromyxobacter diazotrophicus]GEJ56132.1 hypothetical protein AMYX_08730 [Anaeromyxobacter diazotrophicus]
MRVLFEEDVRARLAGGPPGGTALSCLVDLHVPWPGLRGVGARELAESVLRRVAERRAGWLDLAIFGREPLRELGAAAALSSGLQRACLAWGVGFAAYVVGDGAGLDAAAARQLARAGVARLQVALEVPRRSAHAGGGGWLRVLDAAAQACARIRLVLRVNPEPPCDFEALMGALEERGLPAAGPAVALYLARRAPWAQQARELVALSALLEASPEAARAPRA